MPDDRDRPEPTCSCCDRRDAVRDGQCLECALELALDDERYDDARDLAADLGHSEIGARRIVRDAREKADARGVARLLARLAVAQ